MIKNRYTSRPLDGDAIVSDYGLVHPKDEARVALRSLSHQKHDRSPTVCCSMLSKSVNESNRRRDASPYLGIQFNGC